MDQTQDVTVLTALVEKDAKMIFSSVKWILASMEVLVLRVMALKQAITAQEDVLNHDVKMMIPAS